MAIGDFFWMNDRKYAKRIKRYSNAHLQKQDIVKFRQIPAGLWSYSVGMFGSAFTHGASLAVAFYGVRRFNVAGRKLRLIQLELLSRGLQPHDPTKRDLLIPLAAGLVGSGIGLGIDVGVGHLIASCAADSVLVPVPTGKAAIHAVLSQPAEVSYGVENGVEMQVSDVATLGHTACNVANTSSAQVLGKFLGQAGAKALEAGAGSNVAGTLVDKISTQVMGNRVKK